VHRCHPNYSSDRPVGVPRQRQDCPQIPAAVAEYSKSDSLRTRSPSVRQATGWLTRHPVRLRDDERTALEALLERSPVLAATRDFVQGFAEIMIERREGDFGAWMTAVDGNGDRALRSIVAGLRRDLDAGTAGLTLPYSAGPVEHINRVKMLDRQMYGHANLELLRKRAIHTV
jgi:transposase